MTPEEIRENIEIVSLISFSSRDNTLKITCWVHATFVKVKRDIEDFSGAMERLKQQLSEISSQIEGEEVEGNEYKLKHIQRFEHDHPLVGTKGLRLKVCKTLHLNSLQF